MRRWGSILIVLLALAAWGAPVQQKTVSLAPGWNPVAFECARLTQLTASSEVLGAASFDGTAYQVSPLSTSLDARLGYWIYARSQTSLTYSGDTDQEFADLRTGWNLVSFQRTEPLPVTALKVSAGQFSQPLYELQPDGSSRAVSGSGQLAPGRPVWIFASQAARLTWAVPASQLPTALELSPQNFSLGRFSTAQVTVRATFPDATRQDVTASAEWSADVPSAVGVSQAGLVTGLVAGSYQVTARFAGLSAVLPVTVTENNVPGPVAPTPTPAPARAMERRSVGSGGVQGNNNATGPGVSSDGRFVAFHSSATNLVAGDTNGFQDCFVQDRQTNTTTRVSVATGGAQGNGHSASFEGAALSADGNIVIFASDATNLVAGDTNGARDIFAHDRGTGATTLVSRDSAGVLGNNNSFSFSVSADGRYVAFRSSSSNLVAGDTNGVADVFLHDRTTGATTRVSVTNAGGQATNFSDHPYLSPNGLFVAFDTDDATLVAGDTNGFVDCFVRDVTNSTTTRVSLTNAGGQANGESRNPKLSNDGRFVAFDSNAPDIVAGDTNIAQDVFVRDRTGGTTLRVSLSTAGAQGNGNSNTPSISSDGDRVMFQSSADTLVTPDTNGFTDVFLHVRSTGATTIVSRNLDGTQSDDLSTEPLISPNGLVGLFRTAATNIVSGDTNGFADVFGLFGLP